MSARPEDIKNDVLVLTHLFLSKHINKPIHSQSLLLQALEPNPPVEQCAAVLTRLLTCQANKQHPTIRNIAACCLLNHILLEKKADQATYDAISYCLPYITHKTYLPSREKKIYLLNVSESNEEATRWAQNIYSAIEEKSKELSHDMDMYLIPIKSQNAVDVFTLALMFPEQYTSKLFNKARLLGNDVQPFRFTLWNFLCDRNIYIPPETSSKQFLAALHTIDHSLQYPFRDKDKVVLKTMTNVTLQLLFHNGNFT